MTWQIPTTRADGQALAASELSGYEIYYTNDTLSTNATIQVSGSTTTSYDVSNLAAGTYSFAMSAIDTAGVKSSLSAVVTVTFSP